VLSGAPFLVPWMLRVIDEYAFTNCRTVCVSATIDVFTSHASVSVEAMVVEVVDTTEVLLVGTVVLVEKAVVLLVDEGNDDVEEAEVATDVDEEVLEGVCVGAVLWLVVVLGEVEEYAGLVEVVEVGVPIEDV